MQINKQLKMADLIHQNYMLLPVINRFGINLGFGEKTVDELCSENNVNVDFFLEIINAFHDKNYFPEKHLQSFSMQIIVNYLKKTHEYFLKVKIPNIENCINNLIDNYLDVNKTKLNLVNNFYKEYKHEFTEHVGYEDKIVYPYVLEIEKKYKEKQNNKNFEIENNNFTISKYAKQHENVEEKLFDLKNIIIKYLPIPQDSNFSNLLLFELFEMEKELNDHQRIEDKVLIPKVISMENYLNN